jgi:hypothetical protein
VPPASVVYAAKPSKYSDGFLKKNIVSIFSVIVSIFSLLVGTLSLTVAISSLGWNAYIYIFPKDPAQPIVQVLELEAKYSRERDCESLANLYEEQATIRSIFPMEIFTGRDQIRRRCESLPEFFRLAHLAPTVAFDSSGTYARVQAGTSGQMKTIQNDIVHISSVKGEEWTLRKYGNVWLIADFTYGLP